MTGSGTFEASLRASQENTSGKDADYLTPTLQEMMSYLDAHTVRDLPEGILPADSPGVTTNKAAAATR